jgi:RHS repeat-associated protein
LFRASAQHAENINAQGIVFRTEQPRMLWSRSLQIMEERSGYEKGNGRWWYQWGVDVGGGLESAGGIGGLVAILEENSAGEIARTLLPVTDGLGSTTAVIDKATGKTIARFDFSPFGEPLGESGETWVCPFRWQTKYYDAESQHYYFGYRYYDPRLGRWLSRDPIRESGGFNLYAYCGNDPVNKHDPTGMAPEMYTGNNADGEALIELTARICNGVPQVRYGDWANWWGPIVGGEVKDWWQAPNSAELARLFRKTSSGWRLATEAERTATWNQQLGVALPIAMRNARETCDAVAKVHYGTLALATCPVIALESGLTWGTGAFVLHEGYAGTSMLTGAVTGENYATSPEGALLNAFGAPDGAVMATDMVASFGAPFSLGRGPQMSMPGPTRNPLNYRPVLESRVFMGVGLPKFRYIGQRPRPTQSPSRCS